MRTSPEAKGHGALAPSSPERAELLEEVLRSFRDPAYAPPITPAVALELLALARRTETRFADVARVCAKDPVVAARVLSMAQSAFFARGSRVITLEDAVARVGFDKVAQLFLEVTMTMRVFRAPGYDGAMSSLRRHSTLTAYVARALCAKLRRSGEHAFMCGLLHDVGVAAAAYVIGTRVPFAFAWPVILEAHSEAGRILCRAWRLPAEIEIVVGYHEAGRVGAHLHPSLCVNAIAEWVTDSIGFALEGTEPRAWPETESRALGVDAGTVAGLVEDAKKMSARL
jgi:HD-like signal output (HDOD) protein